MNNTYEPKTHAAALSLALLLAIRATSDEKSAEAKNLASTIAHQMDDLEQVQAVRDLVEACLAYFTGEPA